jgi:cyclopropane fatty-acyl-phospholipid synthase-like methyltransferase
MPSAASSPSPRRAALRAWSSFEGLGTFTRLFLLARSSIIPFAALDPELRHLKGRVLSIGCGHGVLERYLAEVNPDVEVLGIELDDERVAAAARSEHRYPRVTIRQGDVRDLADLGTVDAAIAVDLFHHVPVDDHPGVARSLAGVIRSGGRLLVKDMNRAPAWKHAWNRWHDRLVNGDDVNCRTPAEFVELFVAAGFFVERTAFVERAASPYPQFLAVFVRA